MKDLNILINAIKEIDKCLDAYDFKDYTFEEYQDSIMKGEKGNKGLRNLIKYNSAGSYVWTSWMQESLDNSKRYANILYKMDKNNGSMSVNDKDKLLLLIKRLGETKKTFKKNTDDYSIYPIQSELIGENLTIIKSYLENILRDLK